MFDMPEKEDLVQHVKEMVKAKGAKWTSGHRLAIDEVLDVIDKDFLDSMGSRFDAWERTLRNADVSISLEKREIERKQQDLDEREEALSSIVDQRGKQAYQFASTMSNLFASMNRDVREYVSYAVYAYLTGDKSYNPMEVNND